MTKTTLFFSTTLIIIIVLAGFLVLPKLPLPAALSLFGSAKPTGKPSGYQAVFLSNGQVYFGKLEGFNTNEPVLREVYYLNIGTVLPQPEANQSVKVAPLNKEATPAGTLSVPTATLSVAPTKTGLTLVKLGAEIHGPTDEMQLNKDQILLVENLRDDSQVVAAIKRYQDSLKVKK